MRVPVSKGVQFFGDRWEHIPERHTRVDRLADAEIDLLTESQRIDQLGVAASAETSLRRCDQFADRLPWILERGAEDLLQPHAERRFDQIRAMARRAFRLRDGAVHELPGCCEAAALRELFQALDLPVLPGPGRIRLR